MSSNNQATSEITPLLDDSLRRSSTSPSWEGSAGRAPPKTLIPAVLATRIGSAIPSATLFELFRQTVCRLSNSLRGHPASLTPGGRTLPQFCDSPQVMQDFAIAVAILGAIGGVISMVGYGILSRISPRKPAFLFILLTGITWSCLIAGSQVMPYQCADWVFLVGMLLHMLSSSLSYGYLVDMYIVDVCDPEEMTATLSKIGGWSALGTCISFALGGSITTKIGNPLIVFYIATAIFVGVFVHLVFVLPEIFPEERRKELSRMRSERSDHPTIARSASLLPIFEPLKILVPTRASGGTRNWRLTWCALHTFLYVTTNAHASSARLVFVTLKYNLTPADTGLFLTTITASSVIVFNVIVPPVIRLLRPFYRRKIIPSHLVDEGLHNSEASALETSDCLDVHLAFFSCVIGPISSLGAATSRTSLTLMLSGIFIGFSAIHDPMVRNLVASSVDPLKQGEALAAIEMVDSAARVLSPIVMGGIFTATINVAPLLLFYVHLVVLLVSAGLLLLVRDADGFQGSNGT